MKRPRIHEVSVSTVYKLTRPNLTTYGDYQYRIGEWHEFSGQRDLCGPGWSHAYLSPELAVLLNPIHAAYAPATLWRAEGVIGARDHDLKVGCSKIRLLEPIAQPEYSRDQRIYFAIRAAQVAGERSATWQQWAAAWIAGTDRTAAWAAAWAAERAEAEAWAGAVRAAAGAAAAAAAQVRETEAAAVAAVRAARATTPPRNLDLRAIAREALAWH